MTKLNPGTEITVQVRKLTHSREYDAFFMQKHEAKFQESLTEDQKKALYLIEIARGDQSGFLDTKTTNWGTPGKSLADAAAERLALKKTYDQWSMFCQKFCPAGRLIVIDKIMGKPIPDIAADRNIQETMVTRLLNLALEAYADIAGWTKSRPKIPPTGSQSIVLEVLRSYRGKSLTAPSYALLARLCGHKSTSHTHRLVDGLIERGWIARLPGRKGALVLL